MSNLRRLAEPHRSHSFHRVGHWVVGTAAAFTGFFAVLAAMTDGRAVWNHVVDLSLSVFVTLLGLSLVNYAARVVRWWVFSGRLGIRIPWGRSGVYYVAGFAMTMTPGKLGEVLRLWLLHRGHGYRYDHSAGLLVADRVSDAGAMLLLCIAGASSFGGNAWLVMGTAVPILAATAVFLRPGILVRIVGWLYGSFRCWPRLFARLRAALRHASRLASWQVYGGTLLLAVFGWLAEVIAFELLLAELGARVTLTQAMFVFAFAMLAGAVTMLPGGLGGTEVSMVGLLVAIGVDLDVAIAGTAIIRATTLWFAVALGFLALPLAMHLTAQRTIASAKES
jgi:uncharacterized protein (TIRG00374 family)